MEALLRAFCALTVSLCAALLALLALRRRRYGALREAALRYAAMTKESFDPRSGQAWARDELLKLAKPEWGAGRDGAIL